MYFGEEGEGWSVSVNVLVAIEVWLKLQRGATVPADLLKPFSKLIDPKYIQRSGRKPCIPCQKMKKMKLH